MEERWVLTTAEYELVKTKNLSNRLDFAVLLVFFREWGRFPHDESDIDPQDRWYEIFVPITDKLYDNDNHLREIGNDSL